MQVTFDIPDTLADQLRAAGKDPARAARAGAPHLASEMWVRRMPPLHPPTLNRPNR